MKKQQISETELNKQMVEFLLWKGCFVWRNNVGGMQAHGRFVHFGKAGSGDIIGMSPGGTFLSVENKSNGEPISPAQKEFARAVADHGGCALFVTSLDDLRVQYNEMIEEVRQAEADDAVLNDTCI